MASAFRLFCFLTLLHVTNQQSSGENIGGNENLSGNETSGSGLSGSGSLELIQTTETSTTEALTNPPLDYLMFINILEDDNGNFGELGRTLDGCSRPIYMNEGFPFGSRSETILRVCSNGVISVGRRSFYWWYPDRFPSRYFGVRESNVVALFWNDHDHRAGRSRIAYKTYTPEQGDIAAEKISRISTFVSNEVEEEFTGIWMLVAHWINVPPYPFGSSYYQYYYGSVTEQRNTYQSVIITDGLKTYAVFIYNCDMIEWSGRYRYSVVGYNINSKSARFIDFPSFRNHPLSREREISEIACSNMNRGIPWSNLVYQIGAASDTIQVARAECLKQAILDDRLYSGNKDYDLPCPCSFWQAIFDNRYSYASYRLATITNDYSLLNSLCYVQRFNPSSNRGVQLCCYSRDFENFGALLGSAQGYSGSSLLRHHPFWDSDNYMRDDYQFREYCCFDSNSCSIYTRRRPADRCTTYRFPRRAWCWGDPHITNLDGGVYTFNGWGEYTLLDINTDNTSFVLQGRTHPVTNSTATQLVALAFGLSKYSAVEVRLPGDNETEPLLVFFEGRDITANVSIINSTFEHINATITRASLTSLVTSFPNGIGMIVNASAMLGFTLSVPDEFQGQGAGLSGNFNGNPMDDVVFKNGTMLTPPVADRVLHEVGQSWRIEPDDSLFTYPDGTTAQDFQHPDHMPVFLDDVLANAPQHINDTCNNNTDCIFDAIQTGDLSMGLQTMASNQQNKVERIQGENTPPTIVGPPTLRVNLGETAELQFNVTDTNISSINVFTVGDIPPNSDLSLALSRTDYITYVFRWTPQELANNVSLLFVAEDELEARSILSVQVQICACQYGNCTIDGITTLEVSTIILNCECPEGREGDFCEVDSDGCAETLCFEGVECTDIPAPGTGATCGDCPDGYIGDGGKCADIDECANSTHNCADVCINTEGGFTCACRPGYQLLNETHCEDIDECSILNGGCHQLCNNSEGGFNCSCRDGYVLSLTNMRNCSVVPGFECNDRNPCEQLCVELPAGTEQCGCSLGFVLKEDGVTCENINECEVTPCDQNAMCTDIVGSFACRCAQGFIGNGMQCQDLNECVEAARRGEDICDTVTTSRYCMNTAGSYMCVCPSGTEFKGDQCINSDSVAPPGAEEFIVIINLQLSASQIFTDELEAVFQQLAAEAVNSYCETNECRFEALRLRRQITRIMANDVFITDIAINANGVEFSVYIQTENGLLSGSVLLAAINAFMNEFNAQGFSFSATLLVTPTVSATVPPMISGGLTYVQRVIIAVVVSVGLAIIVVLIIIIVCCCIAKMKKKGKIKIHDQEMKKLTPKSNQIQPEDTADL